MSSGSKSPLMALHDLLSEEPSAQAHFDQLADYERKMCFDWIADAPTAVLREQRICRLARRLWLTSFDPMYDLADLAFSELEDLYGAPRLLQHLPEDERLLALQEGRVLGGNHERNYDDSRVWFRTVSPRDRLWDEVSIVYPRPCVLTSAVTGWLDYNGWDTTSETRDWLDLHEDKPPPVPVIEPIQLELVAGPANSQERHGGAMLGVAVSRDSKRAVTASDDGTLRVWDTAEGRRLHVLQGHGGRVGVVALTGDGMTAISGSADGSLRIWGLDSGQLRATVRGHEDEVLTVAHMEGRQEIVSGGADGLVKTWDLASGSMIKVLEGHTGAVLDVAVAKDGQRIISASADGTLRVWDRETGQAQQVLSGHRDSVVGVVLPREQERAVSASADGTLRVWNLATGRTKAIMIGHEVDVRTLAIADMGRSVVSASADGTLRVWGSATGALQYVLSGHSQEVTGLSVAGDGQRAISVSADSTVHVWDLKAGQSVAQFPGANPFSCCALSTGGELIVAGDNQGWAYFLRLARQLT
jgi:hypothetical protein